MVSRKELLVEQVCPRVVSQSEASQRGCWEDRGLPPVEPDGGITKHKRSVQASSQGAA